MKKMSLTYVGLAIIVISYITDSVGVPIMEGDIETTITTIMKIFGALVTFWGRFRQGDINLFGFKK